MIEVSVNRKAAGRVASGHPWIFSSDVTERGDAAPGSVVQVLDHKRRSLGIAHYSSSSQICLRMLSPRVETVDAQFFKRRFVISTVERDISLLIGKELRLLGIGSLVEDVLCRSDVLLRLRLVSSPGGDAGLRVLPTKFP